MQELTWASLASVFTEIENTTNKLIFVVFKTEKNMIDFFDAITDKINRGELSGVFNRKTSNTISMMLFSEFSEYRGEPPDYILYERGIGLEMAQIVNGTDELDAFLDEFNRRK